MIYRIDVAMKAVSKILRRLVLRVKNNRVIKINIFKTRIYCSLRDVKYVLTFEIALPIYTIGFKINLNTFSL